MGTGILQRLVNNFGLKLLSIVLAMLLSVYVVRYVNPEIPLTLYLPLKVKNLSPALLIVEPDPLPDVIQIRVRGPYLSVQQLPTISHSALVNCASLEEPGRATLRVEVPDFGAVQIVYQDRNFLDITTEKLASVEMQLVVDRQGEVNGNFDVGSEELSQSLITIAGPEPVVERINVAQVEPEVEGLQEDLNLMLPVRLYDENHLPIEGPALRLTPPQVRYALRLVPIGSIKVLTVYPDFQGRPPEGFLHYGYTSKPLYIPVEAELVPGGEFVVRTSAIDLDGARQSFTTTVELRYPFELPQVSALPTSCEVNVQIIPLEEAGAASIAVQLIGRDPGFEYIITPPDLVVKSEELVQLDEASLGRIKARLYVDGLEPGEHRLAPQLDLPLTLDRVRIDPATVTVTIIQRQD